jgi:hypothetical protein
MPDLQSWTRNETISPDWIRVGADAVGPPIGGGAAPAFNASFTVTGETTAAAIPLPAGAWVGLGMLAVVAALKSRRPVLRV